MVDNLDIEGKLCKSEICVRAQESCQRRIEMQIEWACGPIITGRRSKHVKLMCVGIFNYVYVLPGWKV